jgi:thiol:disulfide interchange protein DsbD
MIRKFGFSIFISTCLLVIFIIDAQAQFQPASLPADTRWEVASISKTDSSQLIAVLHVTLHDGWHTYAHIPGDLGTPTTLEAQLTGEQKALRVLYPQGKTGKDALNPNFTVNTYDTSFALFIPLPQGTTTPLTMKAQLKLLFCSDTSCMPGTIDIPLHTGIATEELPDAHDMPWWPQYQQLLAQQPAAAKTTGQWGFEPVYQQPGLEVTGMFSAILLGLLAGLILNVMPCVLPVVSIKLSSLMASSAHHDEQNKNKAFREHNLYFSAGILTWFTALALLLGLTGQAWGVIFQTPEVVIALTAMVFLLSLSLFGLFSLPVIDLKIGTHSKNSRAQAFFTGVLATLLATPCSGPFLGGVLGWALTQPPLVIMTVFLSIGMGMAVPYVLLAARPGLVRFLPKPGPWVALVEKGVGFFLIGTCIYLINILPQDRVLPTLLILWVAAPAAWLLGLANPAKTGLQRLALRAAAIGILAASLAWAFVPASETEHWQTFDAHRFSRQLGRKVMVVDFTADWCPTCKVLERTVLTESNITRWQTDYDVQFIKVDLTEPNQDGERLLHELGAKSIPTAAVFPTQDKGKRPHVLRDLFTKTQLENLLQSYTK